MLFGDIFDDIYNIIYWLPKPLGCILVIYIIVKISTMGIVNTSEKKYKITEPIPYYRDIPTKDLELVLWAGIKSNLIEDQYDFFGVMLLKWIREGKIQFRQIAGRRCIDFNVHFKTNDDYERDFYHLFLSLSGENHYLEENEFVNYLLYNKNIVTNLYKSVLEKVQNRLLEQELVSENKKALVKSVIIGPQLETLIIQMAGLKKFLEDFSIIGEKSVEEVFLWEYYLIYAQAFGIATKVQEQLKKLYPNNKKIEEIALANSRIVNGLILSIKMQTKDEKI